MKGKRPKSVEALRANLIANDTDLNDYVKQRVISELGVIDGVRASTQAMTILLFHITSESEIERARREGEYVPKRFAADGFIHCSYVHQIKGIADAKYRGQKGLVLVEIDRARITAPVIEENLVGGKQLYPHIYDRLPMSAVVSIYPLLLDEDGFLILPNDVAHAAPPD